MNLKNRTVRAGLKDGSCEECGVADWRGRPLSMALHHVNGDGRDNRLENLRLLCPNCHGQTENFAGRAANHRLAESSVASRAARASLPASAPGSVFALPPAS